MNLQPDTLINCSVNSNGAVAMESSESVINYHHAIASDSIQTRKFISGYKNIGSPPFMATIEPGSLIICNCSYKLSHHVTRLDFTVAFMMVTE